MRKLVSVRVVDSLSPIEGADFIELAHIDGWQCVVRKGEFSEGDLCAYFEIDSFIPKKLPFMEKFTKNITTFNGVDGMRVKTVKLRGQISQGVAIPLGLIFDDLSVLTAGQDITEELGVIKWERKEYSGLKSGNMAGSFPSYIKKTDQERIQNCKWVLNSDECFEVTYKLDGSSITIYKLSKDSIYSEGVEDKIGVCSRNIELKEGEGLFWEAAVSNGIISALDKLEGSFAIQGELLHPTIQGNFEGVADSEIHIYSVFDIDNQEYLVPTDRLTLLESIGLINKHIKVIALVEMDTLFCGDLNKAISYADGDGLYKGYREGVVFKSLTNPNLSFKIISNKYLLKEK